MGFANKIRNSDLKSISPKARKEIVTSALSELEAVLNAKQDTSANKYSSFVATFPSVDALLSKTIGTERDDCQALIAARSIRSRSAEEGSDYLGAFIAAATEQQGQIASALLFLTTLQDVSTQAKSGGDFASAVSSLTAAATNKWQPPALLSGNPDQQAVEAESENFLRVVDALRQHMAGKYNVDGKNTLESMWAGGDGLMEGIVKLVSELSEEPSEKNASGSSVVGESAGRDFSPLRENYARRANARTLQQPGWLTGWCNSISDCSDRHSGHSGRQLLAYRDSHTLFFLFQSLKDARPLHFRCFRPARVPELVLNPLTQLCQVCSNMIDVQPNCTIPVVFRLGTLMTTN